MPESQSARIRKHPLFPLLRRGLLRLLRGAPDPLRPGEGHWNECVRNFMIRQIVRRTGTEDHDTIYGAKGYAAACEGHNAYLARSLRHYAELCAYDTVEQVLRMQGRGQDENLAELEDERLGASRTSEGQRRGQPPAAAARHPPARGLAAMSTWSRGRQRG